MQAGAQHRDTETSAMSPDLWGPSPGVGCWRTSVGQSLKGTECGELLYGFNRR